MLVIELIILVVLLVVAVLAYLFLRKMEMQIEKTYQFVFRLVMSVADLNKKAEETIRIAENIRETCVSHYDYYIERSKQEDMLPEPKIEDEWSDFMGQDGLFSAKALRENKARKGI